MVVSEVTTMQDKDDKQGREINWEAVNNRVIRSRQKKAFKELVEAHLVINKCA